MKPPFALSMIEAVKGGFLCLLYLFRYLTISHEILVEGVNRFIRVEWGCKCGQKLWVFF